VAGGLLLGQSFLSRLDKWSIDNQRHALILRPPPNSGTELSKHCMVTDPTGTPLNVRRFDGKIIGALHNGEIIRVLRTGADPQGKPWAYVAYETNGEGWVYREFISCY
jgi:hypothetical protein